MFIKHCNKISDFFRSWLIIKKTPVNFNLNGNHHVDQLQLRLKSDLFKLM